MTAVLVTGATGMIGPALIGQLLARGDAVRALCRTLPSSDLLPEGVQIAVGDIRDPQAVHRAMGGIECVYHLAARLHVMSVRAQDQDTYRKVNVTGTGNVVAAARDHDVSRMVYFSTVKVYGTCSRSPVTEQDTTRPQTIYARTKLDGESVLRDAQNVPGTILRLSAVFGPNLKGSWAKLIDSVAHNRFLPIGHLKNVRSLTYVEDVARAALLAAESDVAINQCYNVVGYETPSMRQILAAIYSGFARPVPRWRIPMLAARAGVSSLGILGRAWPRASGFADALDQLTDDEVYSGAALRQR